jgi:hypothetical protein
MLVTESVRHSEVSLYNIKWRCINICLIINNLMKVLKSKGFKKYNLFYCIKYQYLYIIYENIRTFCVI